MTPAVESHRLIVRATNINRSNEKSFVLFAFRWRIDSTDDNNEGENDEIPMCRTYQTSSRAPVQSLLRYLSMDWVSNNKLHNWWRCCWQFPDLWSIFNWFTSFDHGQSSDLDLWSGNWAQINDTIHSYDPTDFGVWKIVFTCCVGDRRDDRGKKEFEGSTSPTSSRPQLAWIIHYSFFKQTAKLQKCVNIFFAVLRFVL